MRALALGLLAGVLWLQSRPELPSIFISFAGIFTSIGLIIGALIFLRSRTQYQAIVLLVAGCGVGIGWSALCAHERLNENLSAEYEGRDIRVIGMVEGLPDLGPAGERFRFRVEYASLPTGEKITVPTQVSLGWYADRSGELPVLISGQRWQLTVRLKRPHGHANPGGLDVEVWLLNEGLRATGYVQNKDYQLLGEQTSHPKIWIDRARAALREKILSALPDDPYAGVIVALVIGDQRAVNQNDWEIFNRTGVGHLISISGLHITMIAGLFALLSHSLWRHSFFTRAQFPLLCPAHKVAALAGLSAAFIYVALAGFGIPAQRTLLMIAVVTLSLWLNKIVAVSQVVLAALLVVLLSDPWSVVWPGFWLSFVAIACILYACAGRAEEVQQAAEPASWKTHLQSAGRTQWAVTLGLLPLSFAWFAQTSLISPLANALAIPLVSFVITPLSLLGSVLPSPLSVGLLSAAHTVTAWLTSGLAWLSSASFAVWAAPQPSWSEFALAIAGTVWVLAPRGWPLRWVGVLLWAPMVLAKATAPEQGFWITAFDIGQGNALLIETPNHRLIYDTGPAFSTESDGGSRVLLPYLRMRGIHHLDGLVISHSDTDHSGGARSLWEGVAVDWLSSSLLPDHPLLSNAPRHYPCHAGQHWVWDGVEFDMLHPQADHLQYTALPPNSRSCTLRIRFHDRTVLLTGDIEAPQERALVERARQKLKADVLLVPHHGSGTSSTDAFLGAVNPSVALFQVGYRNRYRHPKQEVVQRYSDRGILGLRTDQTGAVRVVVDETIRWTTYRCEHQRYWSSEPCLVKQ
ncbi:MAG: DNA internalization-related competence protein ComEC/Rec2 [Oxalobacteraceae bacterium]|nr:DNA internalization-related competence protein ComEC/Rec2 [Oxalobacteraceae bacterium]